MLQANKDNADDCAAAFNQRFGTIADGEGPGQGRPPRKAA